MKTTQITSHWILTLGLATGVLVGSLGAQSGAADAFARARVAAEVERDFARAKEILQGVLESAPGAEAETRAWHLLAKVHEDLGEVEAFERALRKASEGVGEAAKEAAAKMDARDDLSDQVSMLALALRGATTDEEVADHTKQLVWLGQSAMSYVIEGFEHYNELHFKSRMSTVAYRLKGPLLARWYRHVVETKPVLIQRAVLRGIPDTNGVLGDPGLLEFLKSKDPRVLADSARICWPAMTKGQVVEWVGSSSPELSKAGTALLKHWGGLLGDDSGNVRTSLAVALEGRSGWSTSKLHALGRVRSMEHLDAAFEFWKRGLVIRKKYQTNPGLTAKGYLERFQALSDVPEAARQQARNMVGNTVPEWMQEDMPTVLDLVEVGALMKSSLLPYLRETVKREDIPRVIAVLSSENVVGWISDLKGHDKENYPDEAFGPLRDVAERLTVQIKADRSIPDGGKPGNRGRTSSRSPFEPPRSDEIDLDRSLWRTLLAMSYLSTQEARDWVAKYVIAETQSGGVLRRRDNDVGNFLIRSRGSDAKWADVLIRVCEEGSSGLNRRVRIHVATHAFFRRRDSRAAPLIMGLFDNGADPEAFLGAALALPDESSSADLNAAALSIVDHCLAATHPRHLAAWATVQQSQVHEWSSGIREVVVRHLEDVRPENLDRSRLLKKLCGDAVAVVPGIARSVLKMAATDPEAEVRREMVKALPTHFSAQEAETHLCAALGDENSDVVRVALERLAYSVLPDTRGKLLETTKTAVVGLLAHESSIVQRRALVVLSRSDPEYVVQRASELMARPHLQSQIGHIAKDAVDRRYAQALILGLKSPDEDVRKVIQEALDTIRYYHEEKARWDRIADGTDITSTSAAEALVKQATQTEDRATRLLAIRSLGTLGVAETLPILIDMVKSGDAEIAKAATDAVLEIQAAGQKAK